MEVPVLSLAEAEDITKYAVTPISAQDIDATFKSNSIGMRKLPEMRIILI